MSRWPIMLFGATVMASPLAPRGCATIGVGITYRGERGDVTIRRTAEQGRPAAWDVLIGANGKRIVPFER